jgi:formate-nitrite transporter family protein
MDDDKLPQLVVPIEDQDHFLGTPGSRYTLVEYGDYESPHCAHIQPIVKELLRELSEDLCFAFRHFPVTRSHPHARAAAEAAEAAGEQGKFWLMHDRLFEHQDALSDRDLRHLAEGLPVDMATFDRDLRSGAPARRVAEDLASGEEAGVEETPTFFVNGRMLTGSYEFLPLLSALQKEGR